MFTAKKTVHSNQTLNGNDVRHSRLYDEPDSSRLVAPDWRIWSQLQIQFQYGAGTTSL